MYDDDDDDDVDVDDNLPQTHALDRRIGLNIFGGERNHEER